MRVRIVLTSVLLAATMVSSSCANKVHDNPQGKGTQGESAAETVFTLDVSPPVVPKEITRYRIVQPDVTVDYVADLGARLELAGQAALAEPGIIIMSRPEESEVLRVYAKSGAMEYTRLNSLFPESPDLPNDDKAVEISTGFLQRTGLWSSDMEPKEVVVGGTAGGKPSHLLVRFARKVDGIPLSGPGNKLGVRIGDDGEVIQAMIHHPEFVPYQQDQCISPAMAFDRLVAGNTLLSPSPYVGRRVVIKSIAMVYYLESVTERQEYLKPAYLFSGDSLDASGRYLGAFQSWVEAVE